MAHANQANTGELPSSPKPFVQPWTPPIRAVSLSPVSHSLGCYQSTTSMCGSAARATAIDRTTQDHPARDAGACRPHVGTPPWARTVSRSWGPFRASHEYAVPTRTRESYEVVVVERSGTTTSGSPRKQPERWKEMPRHAVGRGWRGLVPVHEDGQMSISTMRQMPSPDMPEKPQVPLGTHGPLTRQDMHAAALPLWVWRQGRLCLAAPALTPRSHAIGGFFVV